MTTRRLAVLLGGMGVAALAVTLPAFLTGRAGIGPAMAQSGAPPAGASPATSSAASSGAASGAQPGQPPRPAPIGVPVTTAPVEVGRVPVEIIANGNVVSEAIVTIRTRVDGQIERMHVVEGQTVKRGQPLFTIDSRLNQALLAQQEAQLQRDRALLTRAQADAVRYQSLRGEGYAAQQRLEQAVADAASAAAIIKADEALIQQTRLSIEFATIVAEADGRLGSLPVRPGNYVRAADNTSLGTITQMDPILVQFAVPERWLPEVQAAMRAGTPTVRAQADGDTDPPAEGRLIFVDSAVDAGTGTVVMKARFGNADGRLWPGRYVQVSMVPRYEENAITVPSAALQVGQAGRFVYVLGPDGIARRRGVELGRTVGDHAVVRGQLAAGEKVIVEGAQRLSDGMAASERRPQRLSSAAGAVGAN
ncbi:efflux RND transporter periplasmic adaptor subunit [Roseomonas sp. NAR14]|uniref:Efflux RND transporter periplasmic adaptor subunit n=1 Tax=Roseomonas acroporae TaxID=2937791 RepID=A0A9X1Y5T0_9PROT|nr:efflux RND transporter periplasmic adaptor subunit [Roseomonas acroporae]MCK8783580.1 efflux RND transporter periplasmic adaptor subunit [Roseomonas acroporae]